MSHITWGEIISTPVYFRLAKKINRRYPFMGEGDIHYLFKAFQDAERLQATRPLDNSERNAHYNVYKLGKEYREATKPEKGTEG